MKSSRILFFVFTLAALLGTRAAHAQFGSGIVYDPTQSAHALQQITQGENQLQKWAQELQNWQQHLQTEQQIYTTAVQTRSQIVTMYNLAYQMSRMPQNLEARYKTDWAQWSSLAAPPNTYGNTSPLVNALNFGGLPQAQQGYSSAFVQVQQLSIGKLFVSRFQDPGHGRQSIRHLRVGADDGHQHACDSRDHPLRLRRHLQQSSRTLNRTPFQPIQRQQSQNALLGKINSATLLQIHSQQDTNQILAASVQQQLIAQKQQIDAQNRAINNSIYFQQNFPNTMQNVNQRRQRFDTQHFAERMEVTARVN